MKYHVYCMSPIDYFEGMLTLDQVVAHHAEWHREAIVRDQFERLERQAKEWFRAVGWEGDVTAGPYFFALPDEVNTRWGVVLKQSNNGSTFVASPYRMPWLDDFSENKTFAYDPGLHA